MSDHRLIDANALCRDLSELVTLRSGSPVTKGLIQAMYIVRDAPTIKDFSPCWISVEEKLPENGVHVLVTAKTEGGYKYVCDAFHAEKFSISYEYGDELACEYNPDKDEYFLEEGWYEVIKNWDDYASIVIQDQVTHWMPLPELPKEGKAE